MPPGAGRSADTRLGPPDRPAPLRFPPGSRGPRCRSLLLSPLVHAPCIRGHRRLAAPSHPPLCCVLLLRTTRSVCPRAVPPAHAAKSASESSTSTSARPSACRTAPTLWSKEVCTAPPLLVPRTRVARWWGTSHPPAHPARCGAVRAGAPRVATSWLRCACFTRALPARCCLRLQRN